MVARQFKAKTKCFDLFGCCNFNIDCGHSRTNFQTKGFINETQKGEYPLHVTKGHSGHQHVWLDMKFGLRIVASTIFTETSYIGATLRSAASISTNVDLGISIGVTLKVLFADWMIIIMERNKRHRDGRGRRRRIERPRELKLEREIRKRGIFSIKPFSTRQRVKLGCVKEEYSQGIFSIKPFSTRQRVKLGCVPSPTWQQTKHKI
uniref:Uncharacterized protein n=1 Tax=Salix viminalis TaxID=40686 RepID=A0A6N2KU57_SALVM